MVFCFLKQKGCGQFVFLSFLKEKDCGQFAIKHIIWVINLDLIIEINFFIFYFCSVISHFLKIFVRTIMTMMMKLVISYMSIFYNQTDLIFYLFSSSIIKNSLRYEVIFTTWGGHFACKRQKQIIRV